MSAIDLEIGERLKKLEGTTVVQSRSKREESETVYNIEVEGDHCYRVGDQGILVHNASEFCCLIDDSDGAQGTYPGPYAELEGKDKIQIVAPKRFTEEQKKRIRAANIMKHGQLMTDLPDKDPVKGVLVVVTFTGTNRNVPKPVDENGLLNEAQVDHIKPFEAGGSNSYCNARVISQQLNQDLNNGKIKL